jgi:amino acid adenylation domain-containing protein
MIGESSAKTQTDSGLIAGFLNSAGRFPSRPALVVDGKSFTYDELRSLVGKIAATITEEEADWNPLVAILAHRSLTAYAGVLGILTAGKGYVPLNPKFPVDRLARMLEQSQCSMLIVGEEGLGVLEGLLACITRRMTIMLPASGEKPAVQSGEGRHRYITGREVSYRTEAVQGPSVTADAVAYLLFTSGSTGIPKGVPVNQRNVKSYVRYTCDRYSVNEQDRFSQMFDMTFDLSVHDMFVCWERGACLYAIPEKSVMAPAKFVKDQKLTMWFSVPSVVGIMTKMGMLKPGVFPTLRASLFCGEPLPAVYAQAWQEAAPLSIVENLYGPTETTIAITQYRWDSRTSPNVCVNGIVPIGSVFVGQEVCVINQAKQRLSSGKSGELCLAGSQVTRGYWNNPEKTSEQFVRIPGCGDMIWYRTGDLVKQDETGCLLYLGRIDHQVKIRGFRVELQEVDHVLRTASGAEQVASVAWPVREGIAEGIVGFVFSGTSVNVDKVLDHCRNCLPDYMIPRQIHVMKNVPLNVNGKLDRLSLVRMLENKGA